MLACVNSAPGFPALSAYNPTTMVLAVEDESTYRFRAFTVPQWWTATRSSERSISPLRLRITVSRREQNVVYVSRSGHGEKTKKRSVAA